MHKEATGNPRIDWFHSVPFALMHLAPFLAFWTGTRLIDWAVCIALYVVRMFFLTAGYHRYFAHRAYTLGRAMQFAMAFGGTLAAQKGVLWWAAHHRDHHRYSDTEQDVHSPIRGFWWSHMTWFLSGAHKETKFKKIPDFAKYPELRWLNRWFLVPPALLGAACWLAGGWSMLLIGFFLSTVLLYHGTFTINSLAHVWGRRRYNTKDTSRNNLVLALLTLGEGWHNNHHADKRSARQGFRWWEIDMSYYALKALSWFRLVRDICPPNKERLESMRLRQGMRDIGKEAAAAARKRWRDARRYVAGKKQALDDALEPASQHDRARLP